MRIMLISVCCFLCCLRAAEERAPTQPEWEPVEQAIRAGAPEAVKLLADITEKFPSWPDGFVKYAEVLEGDEDYAAALAAARQALALDPDRADAADLVIRLHNRLGQTDEALAVLERWGDRPDRLGWIHYHAAEARLLQERPDAAKALLDQAMQARTDPPPREFYFLKGRILTMQNDVAGAINEFSRGIKDDPEFADHWFNLGLLQRRRALETDDDELLEDALESFFKAAGHLPDDPQVIAALGHTRLDAGRYPAAEKSLLTAIRLARDAIPGKTRFIAELEAALGLALLKQAEQSDEYATYKEAIGHLDQALAAGLDDPAAINNRLAAVIGAQRVAPLPEDREHLAAKAEQILSGEDAKHISPINLALQYFSVAREHRADQPQKALQEARQALELLETATADTDLDPERERGYHLYRGHVLALIADCQDAESDPEGFSERMTKACAAYRQAGDLGDPTAREHYLYRMNQLGDEDGYEAGWRYLLWHQFLSLRGWASLVGNYGGSEAWRRPHHVIVWAILLLVCLVLAGKNFFLPKPLPATPATRSRKAASNRQRKASSASTRRAATASNREQGKRRHAANAPTRRVDSPKPADGTSDQDRETRPAGAPPRPKRKAPGLSDRAAIDGVMRRVARDREDEENGRRREPEPRRRRRR